MRVPVVCTLSRFIVTVRHNPQSLRKWRRQLDVDGFFVDFTQRMFKQEHDGIDDILLVDLYDLHFLEQEFGERDGGGVDFEAVLPIDGVAEISFS